MTAGGGHPENTPVARQRADKRLVDLGHAENRSRAQAMIMAGLVRCDGQPLTKAGTMLKDDAVLTVKEALPYVSRGGFKLAGALDRFLVPVEGRVCADVGASTGGFTDVLLQRGAARVYALDVGYGQLHWKLRQDARVVVQERVNARHVEALPEPIRFACMDVSFISIRQILPRIRDWAQDAAAELDIVSLVKPQFEAERGEVGKGGIVRDPAVHRKILMSLLAWLPTERLYAHGLTASSITGQDGNREFLVWLRTAPSSDFDGEAVVDELVPPAAASGTP